jgi:hypothetical protein
MSDGASSMDFSASSSRSSNHRLGVRQVVVDRDGDRDLVVLRERHRQVDVDEEVLEDPEAGGDAAELALLRGGQRLEPPGRDRVCHIDGDSGMTPPVGDHRRIHVHGLGEELPETHLGLAGRLGLHRRPLRLERIRHLHHRALRHRRRHAHGGSEFAAGDAASPHAPAAQRALQPVLRPLPDVAQIVLRVPAAVRSGRVQPAVGAPPADAVRVVPTVAQIALLQQTFVSEYRDICVRAQMVAMTSLVLPQRPVDPLGIPTHLLHPCLHGLLQTLVVRVDGQSVGIPRLRGGEQHGGRSLPSRLLLRRLLWLEGQTPGHHSLGGEAVYLVARLHKLSLEGEVHALQTGLHLLQREHALIHDGDAEGAHNRPSVLVPHGELDLGRVARAIGVLVGPHLNDQVICGSHVQQSRVPDDVLVRQHLVSVDLQGPRQVLCQRKREPRPAAFQIDGPRQHRLVVSYDVDVRRAPLLRGDDGELDRIADLGQGVGSAEDERALY